jgi:hypothetical protein
LQLILREGQKIAGNFGLHSKCAPLVSTADFDQNNLPAVSHDPTRKTFLMKLLGFTAGAGLAARFFTRAAKQVTAQAPAPAPIALRTEPRAVARRADTV